MSKKVKKTVIIFLVTLLVGFSVFYYVFHFGARDLATEEALFTVTSKNITAEFASNVVGATKKYSDKAIAVSGIVTAVTDSIVTIDKTIICNFKSPDTTIKNEQAITVKGRLVGFDELMGELKLDQCTINKNN
jgi:hypothetical protein